MNGLTFDALLLLALLVSPGARAGTGGFTWDGPPRLALDTLAADTPEEVRQQVALLLGADLEARAEAVAVLGCMGQRAVAAVPFLIDMLRNAEDGVTRYGTILAGGPAGGPTARALSCIGSPALGPLLEASRSEHLTTRVNATAALAAMRDPRAQAATFAAFGDPEQWVRTTAAYRYAQRGPAAVEPLLGLVVDPDPLRRRTAAAALAYTGDPRVTEALVARVTGDADAGVRAEAAAGLHGYGGSSVLDGLLRALGDADPAVRRGALQGLRDRADPRILPAVAALVGDPDEETRKRAQWFVRLHEDGSPERGARPVPSLIANLAKGEEASRRHAAEVLGSVGGEEAVDALVQALAEDPEPDVRSAAARALGDLGATRAAQALVAALSDPDQWVATVAGEALGGLPGADHLPTLARLAAGGTESERLGATRALATLATPECVPHLLAAAGDPNSPARETAMGALAQMRCPEAAPVLLAAARGEAILVRAAALRALRRYPSPQAAEVALVAAADDHSHVCAAGVELLEALDCPGAADVLLGRLTKPDEEDISHAVFVGIVHYRDARAVQPLLDILYNVKDSTVRVSAAWALGRLRAADAVGDLLAMLTKRDPNVGAEAAHSLGLIGDLGAVEPLIAALGSEDPCVAWAAAEALGVLGDARAVQPLLALLSDPPPSRNFIFGTVEYVRAGAIEALGLLGDARAVPAIVPLLHARSTHQSVGAAFALRRLGGPQAQEALRAALADERVLVHCAARVALGMGLEEEELEGLRHWGRGRFRSADDPGEGQWAVRQLRAEVGDVTLVGELIRRRDMDPGPWAYQFDPMRLATGQGIGDDWVAWEQWWEAHQPTAEE